MERIKPVTEGSQYILLLGTLEGQVVPVHWEYALVSSLKVKKPIFL